mmetsp:Transcript_14405/g.29044  ORF Transcript_14405/g.29044 Transcript_14405/m.29044 type:complete len:226 (+) Transcript_14405:630-1307(+)
MMVTILTRAGDRVLDAGRVPRTDTSHFTKTTVCLTGKTSDAPACNNTLVTLTLGDSDAVDHLILLEHGVDGNFVLEEFLAVLHLVRNGSTVDLDLHQVGLLLAELALLDLRVRENTNDLARLDHALKPGSHNFLVRQVVLAHLGRVERLVLEQRVLLRVGEALFLGAVPVLVEAALDRIGQERSPDGVERPEAVGGLHVSHHTNDNHRRGFEDGNRLYCLLLVQH